MADRTMWRGQSAKLTIGTLQGTTEASKHITSYTFDVYNGSTSANGSFTDSGEGTSNGRAITTSAHVASGNTYGYTDYTVKGYLKYSHNSYGTKTVATSNVVTKSLRVQEPLDAESLTDFTISPTEVWSNFPTVQNITITPSFRYTPFSKMAQIMSSQTLDAVGGGLAGSVVELELDGQSFVEYQNTNADKDLKAQTKDIRFTLYSIPDISADKRVFLGAQSLTIKNAVTALHISESLDTYNNAGTWIHNESVFYTPSNPYSTKVSLVHATTDTAYDGNTINQNGIIVSLDPATGAFSFNLSNPTHVTETSIFKFRVKSVETHGSVYSNVMTLTVHGFTDSHSVDIWEGETKTIANLGIGQFDIPTGLTNVTVKKTADGLGIEIKGNAVSSVKTEQFVITSMQGSQVTINCTVKNIKDVTRTINTGDTITITGQEIKLENTETNITSISKITVAPTQGTAYVSEGNLIYYAPTTAVGNTPITVPITVTTDTGASAVINIKVVDITMTIV